ncbi:hypothetical protein DV736_g5172, partial [Chaetothyriales sp. CBS 134916]
MAVCRFYQQGNCRFGERCRFEHPGKQTQASQNRFGPLQNPGLGESKKPAHTWTFNLQEFKDELTAGKGRPNWILSAFGPGKQPPASLLQDLEWSPEEFRVEFYKQAALGNEDTADQQAIQTWNNALNEIKDVYDNVHNVLEFMKDADSQQKRPSRYDMCNMDGTETVEQFKSSFNQSPQPEASSTTIGSVMFGKPAFGKSGFGSSQASSSPFAQQSTSTFGRPSTAAFGSGMFGKPAATSTAFGQPAFGSSGFGQEKKNPFAPASASSRFGQGASTFGQPTQPSSGFGQSSQPTSTFGQPSQTSPFAQRTQQTSAFGQTSQPSSLLGQASQVTSTFGQPSQPTSAFGKPSQIPAFGLPSQPSSTFGQPSQPSSTFGQPSQASPFSNPFGKSDQPTSSFGQASQPSSGFSKPGIGTSPGAEFGFGMFGKREGSDNIFGEKEGSATAKDQDMDTTSASTGQSSSAGANPFAKSPSAPTSAFETSRPPHASQANTVSGEPLNPSTTVTGTPQTQTKGPSAPVIYAQTLPSIPPEKDASGRITFYRGQPVTYIEEPREHDQFGNEKPATYYPCYKRPDKQDVEKIWFPEGGNDAQVRHLNKDSKRKDLEAEDDEYTEEVKEMYKYLKREGAWRGGKVPLVPPMRQWVDYDF